MPLETISSQDYVHAMRRIILFITTSTLVRLLIWIPLRFVFLRIFGLYVGEVVFHALGGILFLYCLERFFVLFQEDDGRGILGIFIPEWIERPVGGIFWKATRPLRRRCFIFRYGYSPEKYSI